MPEVSIKGVGSVTPNFQSRSIHRIEVPGEAPCGTFGGCDGSETVGGTLRKVQSNWNLDSVEYRSLSGGIRTEKALRRERTVGLGKW